MSFASAFDNDYDALNAAPPPMGQGWLMEQSIWAFILWHPTTASIVRRTKQATAAGGWIWIDPLPIAEQTFRTYPYADRAPVRVRSNGQECVPDWRVIGTLDLDMAVGDQFTDGEGRSLEVVFVRADQYAVRAEAFEVAQ
jgi:hypothetical protein